MAEHVLVVISVSVPSRDVFRAHGELRQKRQRVDKTREVQPINLRVMSKQPPHSCRIPAHRVKH